MKPGNYQVIVLPGPANQGVAYLFPGDQLKGEHLLSTSRVDVAAASSDNLQDQGVTFKQDDSGRISEIRTEHEVLRFP